MEKTRTLLLLLLSALSVPAAAQSNFYLGLKGGVSIPRLSAGGNNPVSAGYTSISGPYFGGMAEWSFNKHWSWQVELNYTAEGGQKNGVQALPSADFASYLPQGYIPPPYFYANFYSKARLNYLELPVLAKYKVSIAPRVRFFVDVGPYVGFLLGAKNITRDSSQIWADPQERQNLGVPAQSFYGNESIDSAIHKINLGVQGAVGIQLYLRHSGYIFLEVGGGYGFLNIQKYAADGRNTTGAATASVGYAIRIR